MSWQRLDESRFLFKVILVGNCSVGKSCMILRATDDFFNERSLPFVTYEFRTKTVDVSGVTAKIMLWDTHGEERFRILKPSYCRGADGVLLVFDITNRKSFTDLDAWLDKVRVYLSEHTLALLVGNKLDMADSRVVSEVEARQFAESAGLRYIETSVKDSTNVKDMITSVAQELVERRKQNLQQQLDRDNMVHLANTRGYYSEGLCFGANTCATI
ncbi:unnamed protein product [Lymnaea stagnalis]|uniref:Uncharacterized protein n=1 Tax=Lymnaea stagnalis TaxID=6523 RepID=A0AAV2HSY7_LYMST